MSDQPTEAYPLTWPSGWKRTPAHQRTTAKFRKGTGGWVGEDGARRYKSAERVTVGTGTDRVMQQLRAFGIPESRIVISSDLRVRLDGLPYANQATSKMDPGAAVYWKDGTRARCIAIDRYDRIADNLAAIAATLEYMRGIERHGGAEILDRAFTGFKALPEQGTMTDWWVTLGVAINASHDQARDAYRKLAAIHHPDKGGDAARFHEIQRAWEAAQKQFAQPT